MTAGDHSRTEPEGLDDRITPRLHVLLVDLGAMEAAETAVDLSSRESRALTFLGRSWRPGDDLLVTRELERHGFDTRSALSIQGYAEGYGEVVLDRGALSQGIRAEVLATELSDEFVNIMSYAYTTPDRAMYKKWPAPSSWVSWRTPLARWYEDVLMDQLFDLAMGRWVGPQVCPVIVSETESESGGSGSSSGGGA